MTLAQRLSRAINRFGRAVGSSIPLSLAFMTNGPHSPSEYQPFLYMAQGPNVRYILHKIQKENHTDQMHLQVLAYNLKSNSSQIVHRVPEANANAKPYSVVSSKYHSTWMCFFAIRMLKGMKCCVSFIRLPQDTLSALCAVHRLTFLLLQTVRRATKTHVKLDILEVLVL